MSVEEILISVNKELHRLTVIRNVLRGMEPLRPHRARLPKVQATASPPRPPMSDESRAKISKAVKERWALARKNGKEKKIGE